MPVSIFLYPQLQTKKIEGTTLANFNIPRYKTANRKIVRTTLARLHFYNCKPKHRRNNSCSCQHTVNCNCKPKSSGNISCLTLHFYIHNCKPKNSRDSFLLISTHLYLQLQIDTIVGSTLAHFNIPISATANCKISATANWKIVGTAQHNATKFGVRSMSSTYNPCLTLHSEYLQLQNK